MDVLAPLLADRTVRHVCIIFSGIAVTLVVLSRLVRRSGTAPASTWLPSPATQKAKRAAEIWFLGYGAVWIACFAVIIAFQWYTWFDRIHYLAVCGVLSLPYVAQPLLAPGLTGEAHRPLTERYCFKANVWVLLFGFIGNYWYTHYFYSVLKAEYTMPSWDFNGVPIPMYLATHFYFIFYHTLSNCVLRKVYTTYQASPARTLYASALVLAMSYFTAFMETLTISGFPCYRFEDRHMAYTLGSAFYAIYFVVSFPVFHRLDEDPKAARFTVFQTVFEALGSGMLVLCLLDFVRVGLGQDFTLRLDRPCKLDPSRTCAPFKRC